MGVSCFRLRHGSLPCRMITFVVFVFIGLGYFFSILDSVNDFKLELESPFSSLCSNMLPKSVERRPSVNGLPTKSFRDNLRNDTYYITGWSSAGFTNAVMNFANMIYLGKLSDRIPILPPFTPAQHIPKSAGIIPFGDIFDLDVLRKALDIDILDWNEVKELPERGSPDVYSTKEIDELGCWTTVKESSRDPVTGDNIMHHIGLDVSYTRVPTSSRLPTDVPNFDEPHVVIPQLAALIYPRNPLINAEHTTILTMSPNGHKRSPDQHISCFDSMYYASSGVRAFEWERSWSPAWRMVGKNLRFTAAIEEVAGAFMARAFKIKSAAEKIPPFIAVHIRRGDFLGQCKSHVHAHLNDAKECFPPLSSYEKRVEDIKEQLWITQNLYIPNVIVMSDEISTSFWDDVRNQGWFFVNHTEEATVERYGEWYPPLIDTVIQSHAMGFVGTAGSTFSLVGERRVQDWNGGIVSEISIRDD